MWLVLILFSNISNVKRRNTIPVIRRLSGTILGLTPIEYITKLTGQLLLLVMQIKGLIVFIILLLNFVTRNYSALFSELNITVILLFSMGKVRLWAILSRILLRSLLHRRRALRVFRLELIMLFLCLIFTIKMIIISETWGKGANMSHILIHEIICRCVTSWSIMKLSYWIRILLHIA
jgi:hypothetical protein